MTYDDVTSKIPTSDGVNNNNTLSTSKSTNRVSSIPFVGNLYFSIQEHRVGYLKNLLCLEDNRSLFSRVSLKSETKDVRP